MEEEIKLSFQMNVKSYAAARRFKNRVLAEKLWKWQKITGYCVQLLLLAGLLGIGIWLKDLFLILLVAGAYVAGAIMTQVGFSTASRESFTNDRVAQGIQTVALEQNGIRLMNGFQKVFIPWHKCFAVKETKKYILLLGDAGLDALAIEKAAVEKESLAVFQKELSCGLRKENAYGTVH